MKLDLKKISVAIASKSSNGSGDPIDEVNKKLAEQGLYYDKMSKTVKMIASKGNPMNQKQMQEKMVEVVNSLNIKPERLSDIPGFSKTYQQGSQIAPETGKDLKELLVKEGIMSIDKKTGDMSITEKGIEMRKKGLLGKYKMEF